MRSLRPSAALTALVRGKRLLAKPSWPHRDLSLITCPRLHRTWSQGGSRTGWAGMWRHQGNHAHLSAGSERRGPKWVKGPSCSSGGSFSR